MSSPPGLWPGEENPAVTDGEDGGVGDASLIAGDTEGGVDDSTVELDGAASSESPEVADDCSTIPTFTTPTKGMNFCEESSSGLEGEKIQQNYKQFIGLKKWI